MKNRWFWPLIVLALVFAVSALSWWISRPDESIENEIAPRSLQSKDESHKNTGSEAKDAATSSEKAKPSRSPASLTPPTRENPSLQKHLQNRVRKELQDRATFRELSATDWRVEARLFIDDIRVEEGDLILEPHANSFQLRSGALPPLPADFPKFPSERKADESVRDLRSGFERNDLRVESAEYVDKSWLVRGGNTVIPCINVEIFYSGRGSFEHDIVCIDARNGTTARSRSLMLKF